MRSLATAVFSFSFFLLAGATTDVTVVNLPLRGAVSLPMTPSGKADVERSGTMTQIHIEIDKLQTASKLLPAMNAYVAWAVSPEGSVENIGEVGVMDGKGRLDTASRFDQLGILITAEPHYMVDRPNAIIAFSSQGPKSETIRRSTVKVEIGTYDYSKLQPVAGNVPAVVAQARAALQVAQGIQADRIAEAEYRLARVAMGTVDEMVSRTAPPEIFQPLANEAIRRAQRAFIAARDSRAR